MDLFELMEKIAYSYFDRNEYDKTLRTAEEIVVGDIRDRTFIELAKRYQRKGNMEKAFETAGRISRNKTRSEVQEMFRLQKASF